MQEYDEPIKYEGIIKGNDLVYLFSDKIHFEDSPRKSYKGWKGDCVHLVFQDENGLLSDEWIYVEKGRGNCVSIGFYEEKENGSHELKSFIEPK